MTKFPPTTIHGIRLSAMISIFPTLPKPKGIEGNDYSFWEKTYWNSALPGQAVTGPSVIVGHGRSQAICMESSDAKEPQMQGASCLMLNGSWEADYFGDADDMRTFFDAVRDFN